jgi:hypothetical protein
MNFSDILSYASKLSKYTSAPPNFNMMRDMKVDFEKPYPDEERMRRGILYWQHLPPEQQAQATRKCIGMCSEITSVLFLILMNPSS